MGTLLFLLRIEADYYPFGLQQQGDGLFHAAQAPENRYRFNGIEHVEEVGLDMAFYRSYDPAIGRWMQIDPKAEKYYLFTPYNGMGNNPLFYSDPNGDTLRVEGSNEFVTQTWQDIAEIMGTDVGKELIGFLVGSESVVTISEVDDPDWEEILFSGGKEKAKVRKSGTTYNLADLSSISVAYAQDDGVPIDGIETKSDETLFHELVHSKDAITGEIRNDPSLSGKSLEHV